MSDELAYASDALRYRKYDEAEHHLRRLLAADSGNAEAWFLLGEVEHLRGHADLAVAYIATALARAPAEPRYRRRILDVLGAASSVPAAAGVPTQHNPQAQSAAAADPVPAPPAKKAAPPNRPTSNRTVVGLITGVRGPVAVPTLAGPATAQQLDIDFQETDRDWQVIGAGTVNMRGTKILGTVSIGHWIELVEVPSSDGRVRRLRNLTTNHTLESKSHKFLFPGS